MVREITKARFTLICHSCLNPIKKGEKYELSRTTYGRPRLRQCLECVGGERRVS